MTTIVTVLQIVAPVLLLAGAGVLWMRVGWDYPVAFVTRLAMTIGIPCLIFDTLVRTEIDPAALATIAWATVAGYGVLTLAFWGVVVAAGLDSRSYLAPLIFGNTGNLGLPLALFAYGDVGLGYAIVIFAVMAVATFTYGIWLVAGTGSGLRVLGEPIVVASVAGAIFLWQGWALPDWAENTIRLAGQLGIPLMLLTLGVAVARLSPGRLGQAVWLSALKALLSCLIALAVAWALGLDPVARGVLVLQMLTPVAVTSYLLAERYRVDAEAVAGLVVVSTLLSILLLPGALALLGAASR